ncbi:MAG: hypothetical protein ACOCWZ_06375 [Spirochaetota bacterium]
MKQTLHAENQDQNTAQRGSSPTGRNYKKKTMFDRIFSIIILYRDSKVFQWVHHHPGLSMALVAAWGMLIIILFILFVITRMVPA